MTLKKCFSYLNRHLVTQLFTLLVRQRLEYGKVGIASAFSRKTLIYLRVFMLEPLSFSKINYQDRLKKMNLLQLTFWRLYRNAIKVYNHLHDIYQVYCTELSKLYQTEQIITTGHSRSVKRQYYKQTDLEWGMWGHQHLELYVRLYCQQCRKILFKHHQSMRSTTNWISSSTILT